MTFCGNDNDIQRKMTLRKVKNTKVQKNNHAKPKEENGDVVTL